MPALESTRYTVAFAAVVCVACALIVASSAVGLRERQETNAQLYRQKNVLLVTGLMQPGEDLPQREMLQVFDRSIRIRLVDLRSGELVPQDKIDAKTYDQRKARNDPAQSYPAPAGNAAKIARLPAYAAVYFAMKGDRVEQVVLPFEGLGMWGTCYGFVSVDPDGRTIRGITFYDQKETPGLGGEIGNPKWQALWKGRMAYDESWEPKIAVIKGSAGPADKDPYRVDGLSGATITSNAVSRMVSFWFSNDGFGPFLKKFREKGAAL